MLCMYTTNIATEFQRGSTFKSNFEEEKKTSHDIALPLSFEKMMIISKVHIVQYMIYNSCLHNAYEKQVATITLGLISFRLNTIAFAIQGDQYGLDLFQTDIKINLKQEGNKL